MTMIGGDKKQNSIAGHPVNHSGKDAFHPHPTGFEPVRVSTMPSILSAKGQ